MQAVGVSQLQVLSLGNNELEGGLGRAGGQLGGRGGAGGGGWAVGRARQHPCPARPAID